MSDDENSNSVPPSPEPLGTVTKARNTIHMARATDARSPALMTQVQGILEADVALRARAPVNMTPVQTQTQTQTPEPVQNTPVSASSDKK